MQTKTTTQEGRIKSITFHFDSRVTLWLMGGDIQSDYFPAYSRVSQKCAKATISEIGITAGCTVEATNHRTAGKPTPDDHVKAQKFAKSVGITFEDKVRFPTRATAEEAANDMNLIPGDVVVVSVGSGWVDGSNDWHGSRYESRLRSAVRGDFVLERFSAAVAS